MKCLFRDGEVKKTRKIDGGIFAENLGGALFAQSDIIGSHVYFILTPNFYKPAAILY